MKKTPFEQTMKKLSNCKVAGLQRDEDIKRRVEA
jgi:hypothetical protein